MRFRYFVGAVAAVALLAASAFPAAALTFNYEQISGFTFGTETSTAGAGKGIEFFGFTGFSVGGIPPTGNTYSEITWGEGAAVGGSVVLGSTHFATGAFTRSGLQLLTPTDVTAGGFDGTITVDGPPVPISTLTHQNNAIDVPWLVSVTIDASLTLFDGVTPLAGFPDLNAVPIVFVETDNTVAVCSDVVGGIPIQFSATKCDDYFTFPLGTFASVPVVFGGNTYSLGFAVSIPVGQTGALFDFVDLVGGDGIPDHGLVRTQEGSTNQIQVVMFLVPAPASLILLGMGLLGVGVTGWVRRRRA